MADAKRFLGRYFLLFVVLLSFALRAYKGSELFFWNVDEDIVALTVRRMFFEHHVQLIGFPVPGGIYLGPIYYYLISIPYLIFRFDVAKLYIFSAFIGAVTTYLIYKVSCLLFEKRQISAVAALIYAVSYFSTVYGRILNGLNIAQVLALLTYLLLFLSIKTKSAKYLLFLGIVLLVSVQNEGSSFSLVVLTFLIWAFYRFKVPAKKLAQVGALFVLFHLPLLVFDLRHNFYISKSFFGFIDGQNNPASAPFSINSIISVIEIFPSTLGRILYPTGPLSTSGQILPCLDLSSKRMDIPLSVLFLASAILFVFVFKAFLGRKSGFGEKIIAVHLGVLFFGAIAYNVFMGSYLFEWILVIFLPAFCIISAYVWNFFWSKNFGARSVLLISLALFSFLNIRATVNSFDNFGVRAKSDAVKLAISKVEGKDFRLESIGSCYQTGYMYLFWYYGHFPTTSYADDMFSGTFYQRSFADVKTIVVIASPSESEDAAYFEKYNYYKNRADFAQKINEIEVIVLEEE